MVSHTACPVPVCIGGARYRIYFGTRDADQHARIGFVEVDMSDPTRVLSVSEDPVLSPGEAGHFDDNAVYPGNVLADSERLVMYYMGRTNGVPPRYSMAIGLAASEDGGLSFHRLHTAPVMDRSDHDPWMVSTPCVFREGAIWRMWYLSGWGWDVEAGNSFYHIKYAESVDGVTWRRDGLVVVDLESGETNVAAPTVLKDNEGYRMWFCTYREGTYRLGFASSTDGVNWRRDDGEVGIESAGNGWDSRGMAYPHVFRHEDQAYLLWSGNDYGRDGFGIAVAE